MGANPTPRSILPFPRPQRVPRVEPLLVAVVGCFAAIALVYLALMAYADVILFAVRP